MEVQEDDMEVQEEAVEQLPSFEFLYTAAQAQIILAWNINSN